MDFFTIFVDSWSTKFLPSSLLTKPFKCLSSYPLCESCNIAFIMVDKTKSLTSNLILHIGSNADFPPMYLTATTFTSQSILSIEKSQNIYTPFLIYVYRRLSLLKVIPKSLTYLLKVVKLISGYLTNRLGVCYHCAIWKLCKRESRR